MADGSTPTSARRWPAFIAVAAILGVVAIVAALLVFVDSENEPPPQNLGAIADLTDRYYGQTVTIEGEVSEAAVAGEAFALQDTDGGDTDVVVVVPAPGADVPALEAEDRVLTTGVVHGTQEEGLLDTPDEIELDFSSEPLEDYRDRAVIVSDQIERLG